MNYIDAEKLIAEIERRRKQRIEANEKIAKGEIFTETEDEFNSSLARYGNRLVYQELFEIICFIEFLQQEQPIEGKQVIIITETNGDANIHWDCRSLEDVMLLLESAKSFIADKQIEELRGQGSGPDYNTTEGRYSHLFKRQREQPEVDLEKELDQWRHDHFKGKRDGIYGGEYLERESQLDIARHFYEFGLNARKED